MNTLIAIVTLLIAGAFQASLPTMWWLGGLRLELLPSLVVYGALTLHRGGALLLALCAGFIQDSLSAAPFGTTALIYGIAAVVMTGVREAFDRELAWVQIGAGALMAAAASAAACIVLGFSVGAVFKILLIAAMSGIITPVIFFVVDYARLLARTS
jgi:rod shape-determining protein MreD